MAGMLKRVGDGVLGALGVNTKGADCVRDKLEDHWKAQYGNQTTMLGKMYDTALQMHTDQNKSTNDDAVCVTAAEMVYSQKDPPGTKPTLWQQAMTAGMRSRKKPSGKSSMYGKYASTGRRHKCKDGKSRVLWEKKDPRTGKVARAVKVMKDGAYVFSRVSK